MKPIHYPPMLQWELTPLCNHNCIHCYNYWRKAEENSPFCPPDYLAIAKRIVDVKPVRVVLTGGEPVLAFNKARAAIEYLHNHNISLSINTNAALITDEIAAFLHEHKISAFVSLPCAIPEICDKITGVEGSLANITKGIGHLKENNVPFGVNMVITHINFDYVMQTAKYAKETLNADYFYISKASKPINSSSDFDKEILNPEEYQSLFKTLLGIRKKFGFFATTASSIPACALTSQETFNAFAFSKTCTAGRLSYAIDSLGNVKACPRDEEKYGNILEEPFDRIWDRMTVWRDDTLIPDECKSCNVFSRCRGGCRIEGYPRTHSRKTVDPNAELKNTPVQFEKEIKHSEFSLDDRFELNSKAIIVQETGFCRVSVNGSFEYISCEFADFIQRNKSFTLKKLVDNAPNLAYNTINYMVNVLVNKRIIDVVKTD